MIDKIAPSIEAALADVQPDHVRVWVSTQMPGYVRSLVAKTLGVKEALIEIMPTYVGGGFGRKTGFEVAVEAVRLQAHEARHPVLRTQFVEDRAADARRAVGLELDAARQVEAVDRVHQAERAGRAEVVDVDRLRQRLQHALARDHADERVRVDGSGLRIVACGLERRGEDGHLRTL